MRKLLFGLLIIVLLAALAMPALADAPCVDVDGDGSASGRHYGAVHIASHTPHGVGLEAHNPGTHRGFSLCLGVHE